ncbi:MAG TPA: hypothetical protein VN610_09910 [Bryobacteraceae bacterium]|nr:hypothetical protein [Bryobacteraceae bacterium]
MPSSIVWAVAGLWDSKPRVTWELAGPGHSGAEAASCELVEEKLSLARAEVLGRAAARQ